MSAVLVTSTELEDAATTATDVSFLAKIRGGLAATALNVMGEGTATDAAIARTRFARQVLSDPAHFTQSVADAVAADYTTTAASTAAAISARIYLVWDALSYGY